jgi:hypothetical protein
MPIVKLDCDVIQYPLIRQTPGCNGVWNDCIFKFNEPLEECDFWIVYEQIDRKETTLCPTNGTLFICGEPPSIRRYNPYFLNKFSSVITCQRSIRHRNKVIGHGALPWFVGVVHQKEQPHCYASMSYDDLRDARPRKDRLLSTLTSGKRTTAGHRRRLDFIRMLERRLGSEFDAFTPDKPKVKDKWETVARYKYHLAIENSAYPHYWTEKIADPFLGGCFPIYHGCPNLSDYFPTRSYVPIDINKPEKAIATIEKVINSETFESSQADIMRAKDMVLNEYNLFAVVASVVERTTPGEKKMITLEPEKQWGWGPGERGLYRANQIMNWLHL